MMANLTPTPGSSPEHCAFGIIGIHNYFVASSVRSFTSCWDGSVHNTVRSRTKDRLPVGCCATCDRWAEISDAGLVCWNCCAAEPNSPP